MLANRQSTLEPSQKRFVSIRWTLPIYLLCPLVSGILLTGWLAFRSGQRAVNDVVNQLSLEIASNINNQVNDYLSQPVTISELLSVQVQSQKIDIDNVREVGKALHQITRSKALVNNLFYGNQIGEFVYSEQINNQSRLDYVDALTQFKRNAYSVNSSGEIERTLSTADYDPRQRIWYQEALRQRSAVWSDVYISTSRSALTITRATPVQMTSGEIEGVFGIDVYLSELSDFLRQLKIGESGQAFVVEPSGNLIATSAAEQPFTINEEETKRLLAIDSQNDIIRFTANQLVGQVEDLNEIAQVTSLAFKVGRDRYISHIYPLRESFGVDWLIVVTVPERDFLQSINASKRRILLIGIFICGVVSLLALSATLSIIRPIQKINQAASDVESNCYQPDALKHVMNRSDEFSELATIFNDMAAVVISREQSLSEQVDALKNEIDNYGHGRDKSASYVYRIEKFLSHIREIRQSASTISASEDKTSPN